MEGARVWNEGLSWESFEMALRPRLSLRIPALLSYLSKRMWAVAVVVVVAAVVVVSFLLECFGRLPGDEREFPGLGEEGKSTSSEVVLAFLTSKTLFFPCFFSMRRPMTMTMV